MNGYFLASLLKKFINDRERLRGKDIIKRCETTFDINATGSSSKALCFKCNTKQDRFLFIYKSPSYTYLSYSIVDRIDLKTKSNILRLSL